MVRAAYLAVYAGLAALGIALVARPGALWLFGLGLFRPVLPWQVRHGWAAALLAVALAAFTLQLALRAASGRTPPTPQHAAFLALVAAALALRLAGAEARLPVDPGPRLLQGLRTAAGVLDAEYAGAARYAPTAGLLQGALAALPRPGFVFRGRELPLSTRILHGMRGAQTEPLPGDLPGTIYVCISADEQRAWVSALALDGALRSTVQADAGTHSEPGRDPLLPAYPALR